MKKKLTNILHGLLLILVSAGFFVVSFFYEINFTSRVVLLRENQVSVENLTNQKIDVNRGGSKESLENGDLLQVGDIVITGSKTDSQIRFSRDGVLRMGDNTRILINGFDLDKSTYIFKILEGKVWLNNLYSNANVNVLVDGAVILPNQSISYYKVGEGEAEVYAYQANLLINFISSDYDVSKLFEENSGKIINQLFLPQGTEAIVYKDKVQQNQSTIAKLLFSKLTKEFNYGVFDKSRLSNDDWLSNNLAQESVLTSKIRDQRLSKIRTRGLKYSTLESTNYKSDEFVRTAANTLTFSEEKVGQRNLDALYNLLYDSQYLFDYGRMSEAKDRLEQFNSLANQLFIVYGDSLKQQFKQRVKLEYEYLSFVNPSDSLYQLRLVLEKIYLDSIKGSSEELPLKFAFLTEKLNNLGYFAESKDFKNLKLVFDNYGLAFADLIKTYDKQLTKNIVFVQQQNQALDNLFMQYPDFYRVSFITEKLFIENKYLSLLPSTNDKLEEVQTVIAQRIDFLRKLEYFFLQGSVPLLDAQNIIDLLISEIAKIELPDQYKVAVSSLFNSRLEDYGVFRKFLGSPEYVGSAVRGVTMQDRFAAFQKVNVEKITIDDLRNQLSNNAALIQAGGNQYESGKMVEPTVNTVVEKIVIPSLNEDNVVKTIDGNTSVITNLSEVIVKPETTTEGELPPIKPVRVPRVKPKVE